MGLILDIVKEVRVIFIDPESGDDLKTLEFKYKRLKFIFIATVIISSFIIYNLLLNLYSAAGTIAIQKERIQNSSKRIESLIEKLPNVSIEADKAVVIPVTKD